MIFDPNLVFCVIDSLFGGSGKFHLRIEGRDFSPTEQRIIQRMLEVTLEQYTKAWGALCRFNFQYQRSEMHTQFANIASPSEIVVATTFNLEIGDSGGEIHICFPYAMLEPIRDVLYSSLQGDGQEPDRRWVRQLTQQVQSAEIELTAELAKTTLTVGDLLKLRVGDFVELPLKEIVQANVDGVPVILLEGRIFDAQEAKDKGLVTRVVPDAEVAAEARAAAQRIAEGAPLVARWHKQFARRLADGTPLTAAERDECFDCFDTEDFRIGYAAFLAKTKPEFVGR